MSMVSAKVRLRCSRILPVLIYLIKLWVWVCAKVRLRCLWISLVLIYLIKMWVWAYAKIRLWCSWISLVLVYLIKMWVWHVPKLDCDVHGYHWYWFIWSKCGVWYIEIIRIDLFDQNKSVASAKVRLRCLLIPLVLIYLIKLWVWYVPKLDSDVHGYYQYWLIWSKCMYDMYQS